MARKTYIEASPPAKHLSFREYHVTAPRSGGFHVGEKVATIQVNKKSWKRDEKVEYIDITVYSGSVEISLYIDRPQASELIWSIRQGKSFKI